MFSHIGIDAGGTLTKVAYQKENSIQYMKFSSNDPEHVVSWIQNHFSEPQICITGGKGEVLQSFLAPTRCSTIVEFEATCKGIKYLLQSAEIELDSFVLTNIGTGTSIHLVTTESNIRIAGTGVGGGTLIGLSSLLTGIHDYSNILALAMSGQREVIDLKVKDIYEGSVPPILGELTASNFGKANSISLHEKSDLIASVIGLVGETVVNTSILAAEHHGIKDIVYIGSSLIDNGSLRNVLEQYTRFKDMKPFFVNNGEYSGAIGALLSK